MSPVVAPDLLELAIAHEAAVLGQDSIVGKLDIDIIAGHAARRADHVRANDLVALFFRGFFLIDFVLNQL